MMLSTIAAGLAIIAFTAALELTNKDYEVKKKEFENSK